MTGSYQDRSRPTDASGSAHHPTSQPAPAPASASVPPPILPLQGPRLSRQSSPGTKDCVTCCLLLALDDVYPPAKSDPHTL